MITNTTNITLSNHLLPIDTLLHRQYDNRQMKLNRLVNIRPRKTSNSIETLKKMIAAYRQRSLINSRILTSPNVTGMFRYSYVSFF